jgi:hypothetical protein
MPCDPCEERIRELEFEVARAQDQERKVRHLYKQLNSKYEASRNREHRTWEALDTLILFGLDGVPSRIHHALYQINEMVER